MKILCVNPAVSVRAYRQMKALNDIGHTIDLLYIGFGDSVAKITDDFWASKTKIFKHDYPLSHFPRTLFPGRYKGLIKEALKKKDYDLVFAYSMPDTLAAAATRYAGVPVVYDIRDMTTAFQKHLLIANYVPPGLMGIPPFKALGHKIFYTRMMKLEGEALRNSHGRTFVSDHTYDLARKRHGCPKKNSLVFYNYAMKKDIQKPLDKVSSKDGETHIVFEGVLSTEGYRKPLLELFHAMAKQKLHIHIYGIGSPEVLGKYMRLATKSKYYHLHDPLPHRELMKEMTRYDYGIIPFIPPKTDRDHFDTMLPNKLFDYLAAGLPLIVPDSKSMVKFVKKEHVGVVFKDAKGMPGLLKDKEFKVDPGNYVIENQVHRLTDLIKKITK